MNTDNILKYLGIIVVGAIGYQIVLGDLNFGAPYDPLFVIAGWQVGAFIGFLIATGWYMFFSKPEGYDTADVTCPKCGHPWNIDTGRGIRRFDNNRVQCQDCGHTERGF